MTSPPGPDGPQFNWSSPSPEFLAALQQEMARRTAETAMGATDPLSPMDASWVAAHTLFQAACRGGFTERQAIIAVVEILLRQQ